MPTRCSREQASTTTPGELPRGSETILLVEDEGLVRGLARETLERNGYSVIEAAGGGEALEVCEGHEGRIDLLVTDVVMPEMSGRQLADRLTSLRPALTVLYISGYTDDVIVHRGVLAAGTAFLQKPFTMAALVRKVREVLDARRAAAVH